MTTVCGSTHMNTSAADMTAASFSCATLLSLGTALLAVPFFVLLLALSGLLIIGSKPQSRHRDVFLTKICLS